MTRTKKPRIESKVKEIKRAIRRKFSVEEKNKELLKFEDDPYEAAKDAHTVTILTEWDEFKSYDW